MGVLGGQSPPNTPIISSARQSEKAKIIMAIRRQLYCYLVESLDLLIRNIAVIARRVYFPTKQSPIQGGMPLRLHWTASCAVQGGTGCFGLESASNPRTCTCGSGAGNDTTSG